MPRSPGEGSVLSRTYKRKDGSSYKRYFARIGVGTDPRTGRTRYEDGQMRKTKAQANQDRAQMALALTKGSYTGGTNTRLADYLAYWLAERKKDLSPGGYYQYEVDTRLHIIPALGRRKLSQLEPVGLSVWQAALEKSSSPYVAQKAARCLSSALTDAVYWHLIDRNPMRGVRPVKLPKSEAKIWSKAQAATFLAAARPDRYFPFYYLLLSLGMRVDELRGILWADIDTRRGVTYLHVQRQNDSDGATPRFTPTKNKQDRLLDLTPDVLDLLAEHKYKQDEWRAMRGDEWPGYDLVFTTRKGTAAPAASIRNHLTVLCAEAQLPRLKLHELRHTAGSLWLDAGMRLEDVSKRLGHSSIKITEQIYIHKLVDAPKPVGIAMNELLDVEMDGESTKKDPEAA